MFQLLLCDLFLLELNSQLQSVKVMRSIGQSSKVTKSKVNIDSL